MQPIVSGFTGVQSPLDGGHDINPPIQLSPQPVSPPSAGTPTTSMACGGSYTSSSDRQLGSTRVTHMANGALMTRTLHMAPTSTHVRPHHGRRHVSVTPYPYSHVRSGCGAPETSCATTSGRLLQATQAVSNDVVPVFLATVVSVLVKKKNTDITSDSLVLRVITVHSSTFVDRYCFNERSLGIMYHCASITL